MENERGVLERWLMEKNDMVLEHVEQLELRQSSIWGVGYQIFGWLSSNNTCFP